MATTASDIDALLNDVLRAVPSARCIVGTPAVSAADVSERVGVSASKARWALRELARCGYIARSGARAWARTTTGDAAFSAQSLDPAAIVNSELARVNAEGVRARAHASGTVRLDGVPDDLAFIDWQAVVFALARVPDKACAAVVVSMLELYKRGYDDGYQACRDDEATAAMLRPVGDD